MAAITFSGLSSGIDTDSMIRQLVSIEGNKISILEKNKSAFNTQISTIRNINSRMQTLQTQAKGLSTIDKFLSYETTTSDSDFLTVSATGSANPGSYSIDVNKLAATERRYSTTGYDAKDTAGAAGAGKLTITVNDDDEETEDTAEINITAEDTLENIVAKVNATDINVTAGILYDGSKYFLQLSSKETGTTHKLAVTEGAGLNLAVGDGAANIVQDASNAEIEMDGYKITSDSNSITTAIPGVTLNLKDKTEADKPVNITIQPNTEAVQKKLQGFVDAYNSVASIIHSEFAFNGSAKDDSHLTGDATLRSIQTQLGGMISSALEDLPGGVQALSQIGITSAKDGSLEIDSDKLKTAIADNPNGVAQLFTGTLDHKVKGLGTKLNDLIEGFVDYSDGMLTAKINGINKRIESVDRSISNQEDYMTKYEDKLRAQFTAMETMVSSLRSQSNFLSSI
jgi:flagellar hook-associated protein 2